MPGWVSGLLSWLVGLLASPVAARQQGRGEVEAEAAQRQIEVQREQIEIAARGPADRDAVLGRMRGGEL